MILPEDSTELLSMNIKELWNCYQALMEEETDNGKTLKDYYTAQTEQIRNGISIPIPIVYLTEEWYTLHPTSKKATVLGFGKYNIIKLLDEKQARETTMRQIISQHIDQGPNTQPRT